MVFLQPSVPYNYSLDPACITLGIFFVAWHEVTLLQGQGFTLRHHPVYKDYREVPLHQMSKEYGRLPCLWKMPRKSISEKQTSWKWSNQGTPTNRHYQVTNWYHHFLQRYHRSCFWLRSSWLTSVVSPAKKLLQSTCSFLLSICLVKGGYGCLGGL